MENRQSNLLLENRMKTPTTAEVLRNILARIKSGEELPEAVVEYRHVAGEISAYGALFADASKRRKSRPSNAALSRPESLKGATP
jgi:hypothetical protein